MMTVQELIEKLQGLNPNDNVLIEVDHDEIVMLKEDRIVEDLVTPDHRLATQEDMDARKVVILRA
jgi:hypothetical protein